MAVLSRSGACGDPANRFLFDSLVKPVHASRWFLGSRSLVAADGP